LYDNPDLTIGEIKQILFSASEGSLEKVSEKLDGINLVFTWNESEGDLKVARNGGDLKGGGMDADALASKFANRGNLSSAFSSAYDVLRQSLGALDPEVRIDIFGMNGTRWYSMEIVYSENPNVLHYDGNSIVFHAWPTFDTESSSDVKQKKEDSKDRVGMLISYLGDMQNAIQKDTWKVRGPAIVSLNKISNGSAASSAAASISSAASSVGCSDSSTIQEYLTEYIRKDIAKLKIENDILLDAVISRCVGAGTSLNDIKKLASKEEYAAIQQYVKQADQLMKKAIQPIESAVHKFSVELLKGISSTLIDNPDEETARLHGQVSSAISKISSSGNANALDVLAKQLPKLEQLDGAVAAIEGIVFMYKGNAYKFTGMFAPINQLLGLFKFGSMKESLIQKFILEQLLLEKGEGTKQKKANKQNPTADLNPDTAAEISTGEDLLDKEVEQTAQIKRSQKQLNVADITDGKFHRWDEISQDINDVSFNALGKGEGNGERLLASILGGRIMGGSESYDIEVGSQKYEVKQMGWKKNDKDELTKLIEIRPGTKGAEVFSELQEQLFGVIQTFKEYSSIYTELDVATKTKIKGSNTVIFQGIKKNIDRFLENANKYLKGEISAKELATLAVTFNQIRDLRSSIRGVREQDLKRITNISFGNKSIDVNEEEFIDIVSYAKRLLKTSADDLLSDKDDELVLYSVLSDPIFDEASFADYVANIMRPQKVFSEVDGVFVVSPTGFQYESKDTAYDMFKFVRISQGVPRYAYASLSDEMR